MKTCIIALLAVLVAQGEAFPFPEFGIQARAGTQSSFPADKDFYCTASAKTAGATDAYRLLYIFGSGKNVEESPVLYTYNSMYFANSAFEMTTFCLEADPRTPKRVTSADGSVIRFTPSSSRKYFAVEAAAIPSSDSDLKNGFTNLKQEIAAAGLTARADMNKPILYCTNPPYKCIYLAFLD